MGQTYFTQNEKDPSNRSFISESRLAFVDFYYLARDNVNYFFTHFSLCMKKLWEKIKASPSWRLTGILSLIALLCYLYVLLTNNFVYAAGGDYSIQGISFIYNGYDDWHYYFETGVFPFWDSSNLVGVDNIYGASFYYLFDPFFLFLLIWPRAWLNNIQTFLQLAKLVLAGLFFYKYLRSFKNMSENTRKLGAVAYAFCGWGWFYLWFFHMQEVITFLPLMLLGVEKIIDKKDPRLMTVGMFLMGAVNYQYLAILTVFCFFYAIFRLLQTVKSRSAKSNWQVLGIGFAAFLTGICLCAFIILPSYNGIQDMPRLSETGTYMDSIKTLLSEKDFGGLLKLFFVWPDDSKYVTLYPLMSLIFMNNNSFSQPLVSLNNYANVAGNAGSSMYVSAPFLLLIVPSLIDSWKKKQWSQTIAFIGLAFLLMTPFTYYASGGFGKTAYGRWVIFPVAMLVVFICSHLDSLPKMPKWYLDISIVVVAILFAVVVNQAYSWPDIYGGALQTLKRDFYIFNIKVDLYQFAIIFQGIWIAVCYLFIRFSYASVKGRNTFNKRLLFLIGADMVIMGNISIQGQGVTNYKNFFNGRDTYYEQTKIVETLNKYDKTDFKLFNTQTDKYSATNLGMAEGYDSLSAFCSTINYQADDLLSWSRINYNSGSYYETYFEKRYNLDELMGTKYYLLKASDKNVPYGFIDVTSKADCPSDLKALLNNPDNPKANYKLYENSNYIDSVFAFNSFMSSSSMAKYGTNVENNNEYQYLKTAIVDSDYLTDNEDKFSSLSRHTYTSMSNLSGLTKYLKFYSSSWEYPSSGKIKKLANATSGDSGTLRTFPISTTSVSDADVSVKYHDQLEAYLNSNPENPIVYKDKSFAVNIAGHEGEDLYHYTYSYMFNTLLGKGDVVPGSGSGSTGSNSRAALDYYSQFTICNETGGTPKVIAGEDASTNGGQYISLSYYFDKTGPYSDVYFYGYDAASGEYYQLNQTDNFYVTKNNSGSWKTSKGYYVYEPVYKIVGVIKGTSTRMTVQGLSYEYNSEFQSDVDNLKANEANITYRDANTLEYSTSYASSKAVVINKGYSTGWKLTRTNKADGKKENVELFKADGGLLGYVAPEGDYDYVLKYYSNGFSTGIAITNIALVAQGAMYYIWYSYYFARKELESMKKSFSLKGL